VKGNATKIPVTQNDLTVLRKYFATLSKLNISIPDSIAEEMQNYFVRQRKESSRQEADQDWFGKRIIVAKGLARMAGREIVSHEDWQDSIEMCAQWEQKRK
jgi:DNA replicative helicase MCM subunit Mcm2 (Cdc46/Mcm family)